MSQSLLLLLLPKLLFLRQRRILCTLLIVCKFGKKWFLFLLFFTLFHSYCLLFTWAYFKLSADFATESISWYDNVVTFVSFSLRNAILLPSLDIQIAFSFLNMLSENISIKIQKYFPATTRNVYLENNEYSKQEVCLSNKLSDMEIQIQNLKQRTSRWQFSFSFFSGNIYFNIK